MYAGKWTFRGFRNRAQLLQSVWIILTAVQFSVEERGNI
jgi:hypothetical protein